MSFSTSVPVVPQALAWGVPEPPREFYIPQGARPAGYASLEDAFVAHRAELKAGDCFILEGAQTVAQSIFIGRQWTLTGAPGCTVSLENFFLAVNGGCALRNIAFTGMGIAIRVFTNPEDGLVPWGSVTVEACTFTGFQCAISESTITFPLSVKRCEFFLPDNNISAQANAISLLFTPALTEISGCVVHGNQYNPAGDQSDGPNFVLIYRTNYDLLQRSTIRIANNRHADGPLLNFVCFYLFPDRPVTVYGDLPKVTLDIRDNSWTDHAAGYNIALVLRGPAPGIGPLFIFNKIDLVGNATPNASGRGLLNILATTAADASGHCPIYQAGNRLQNPRITATDWLPATSPDAGLVGYPGPSATNVVVAIQYPDIP